MIATGKLLYDPIDPEQKVRERYWLILAVDEDVGALYRYLYFKQKYQTEKIRKPLWGTHISLIRGENVTIPEKWAEDNNKEITFEYSPEIKSNGKYFWLQANSDEFIKIRTGYGLTPRPYFDFHLTIGNSIYSHS